MDTKKTAKRASVLLAGIMTTALLSGCTSQIAHRATNNAHYHGTTERVANQTGLENALPNAEVTGLYHLANKNDFDLTGYTSKATWSDWSFHSDSLAVFHNGYLLMQSTETNKHTTLSDYAKDNGKNDNISAVYATIHHHTLTLKRNTLKGTPFDTLQMVKYRLHSVQYGKSRKFPNINHHLHINKLYRYKRLVLYPYEIKRKHTNVHFIPRSNQAQYKLKLTIVGYLHQTDGTLPYK